MIPNPSGKGAFLGISLKDAQIPLVSALNSGWHIEPMKGGHFVDIQHAIKWYRAANNYTAVSGLISAAQRGRALLPKKD